MSLTVWMKMDCPTGVSISMKILKVEDSISEYVTTDDEEYPVYRRYSNREWENLIGESWESVYNNKELEEAYKDWQNSGAVMGIENKEHIEVYTAFNLYRRFSFDDWQHFYHNCWVDLVNPETIEKAYTEYVGDK